jgi:diguanylate cyclase (GGDEF)-like protein
MMTPMRILIAEDDITSRMMLAGVLKKSGFEVLETVNGADAWEKLQQPDAPLLIILDWMMPGMNGIEVVRRIRETQGENPPYIIMLTSRGDKKDIITGLDVGANDYLAKPFDNGELKARVAVGCRMIEMQFALIRSKEIMAHQATHDSLTGLLNRRAILDRLHEELSRVDRHGAPLAIGMCDIDFFKKVNDTHGHQTGDDVLCGFSRILRENLREYDAVGRVGGEEFLVVTPVKTEKDPVTVYARLCKKVAESKMITKSGELYVTVSIGVAATVAGNTVDAILGEADTALYRAKSEGRNRIVFSENGA